MATKTIDLTTYKVVTKQHKRNKETDQIELVDVDVEMDPKVLLYELIKSPGIFKNGAELVEAIVIARSIRDAGDSIQLPEKDLAVVKKALDYFIAKKHDPANGSVALGGDNYDELIMRIYS